MPSGIKSHFFINDFIAIKKTKKTFNKITIDTIILLNLLVYPEIHLSQKI